MQKTGAEVVDGESTQSLNLPEVLRHCLGTLGPMAPFLSLSISGKFVAD